MLQQTKHALQPETPGRPVPASVPGAERWLMLVHQLPTHPSNLRVRTWRRLQQVGALAVKQAVYVLPNSPGGREDFEWLRTEIDGAGGQAAVFAANSVDAWTDDALVNEFLRTREEAYAELAREAEACLRRLNAKPSRRRGSLPSPRVLQQLQERLAAIERIDFFGSAGRDSVAALLRQIGARGRGAPESTHGGGSQPADYQGRLWVTRPRPGVDRMASAWLIRKFIDGNARFEFAADRKGVPDGAVPFDMYGVEFTHRGEHCTYEMLCDTFNLREPALDAIGQIVHDLDLKDGRFGRQEAATLRLVIEGLQLSKSEDHDLLAQGVALFEALYLSLSQAARAGRPRPVARRGRPRRPRKQG